MSVAAPPAAVLIDVPTGAVLTLSFRLPTIAFLAKSEPDVQPYWGVNYPNYAKSFPLINASTADYPLWTWVAYKRQFEPTSAGLLTDRLRAASALATRKRDAVWEMIFTISNARNLLDTGIALQESVHLTKRAQAQAQAFVDESFGRLSYPYVTQYADAMGMTMREAAQEILFKAQLDDEVLARTEAIRLKYWALLKTAQLDTIDATMTDFRGEWA